MVQYPQGQEAGPLAARLGAPLRSNLVGKPFAAGMGSFHPHFRGNRRIGMIKLIASDLDGTLLQNGAQKLNPEVFPLIRELRRKGIVFAAASGRQYPNLRRLFSPVWQDMIFLAENGALMMQHGEVIASYPVAREIGLAIIRDIETYGRCEVLLSGKHTSYLHTRSKDLAAALLYDTRNAVTIVDDFAQVDEPFLKISAFDPEGIEHAAAHFQERWGGVVSAAVSGEEWMDFTVANKGGAIRLLQQKFGFQKAEMMAFGDNYNDLQMLEAVGHGYIMENAAEPLRERFPLHAKRVEDTLAAFLEGRLL
ncbi:HAD family phosphatase [Anaerotruncus sp. AF02-27]|nr:HAD family phosphatase [Anaerotruncus sp. AF02-27]